MTANREWTRQEDAMLARFAQVTRNAATLSALMRGAGFDRTVRACAHRLSVLRLPPRPKRGAAFNAVEDEILRRHYPISGPPGVAALLNRTNNQVAARAKKLGVAYRPSPVIAPDERTAVGSDHFTKGDRELVRAVTAELLRLHRQGYRICGGHPYPQRSAA